MLVYNGTSKTKTGDLNITKSVGSLVIQSSRKLQELTNEKISIYVERVGGNKEICNNISLKHFLLSSTFGEVVIMPSEFGGFKANCEIAKNGAIHLNANEVIVVSLDNMLASATYQIEALEYPVTTNDLVRLERKRLNTDDDERRFNVSDSDVMVIDDSLVESIEFTYSNQARIKYTKSELRTLMGEVEPIISINADGTTSTETGNTLILPLVAVLSIDIEKETGVTELTLVKK